MKALLIGLLVTSFLLAPAAGSAQDSVSKPYTTILGLPLPEYARKPDSYYKVLAKSRNSADQYKLGLMYETGDRVELDLAQAAIWYRKAAMEGHVDAMLAIGQMLQNGRGVEQNDADAASWYQRAADQGSLPAQYNLALMLAGGNGVVQDYRQAAVWYEKAAQRGFAKAQYNLAVMLALGQGGAPDPEQAYKWFKIAGNDGNTLAVKNLAVLASRMSAEQLARADRQASDWQPVRSN